MAKDPLDRYGSANELAQELRRITTDRLTAPYAQLEQAVDGGQWPEALALAADIQSQDPNYRDISALEQQAQRGQWSEQWRTQAEIALADDDFHAVAGALTQWRRVNPDDPDIQRVEYELALAEQYVILQGLVADEQWMEARVAAEVIQEQDLSLKKT